MCMPVKDLNPVELPPTIAWKAFDIWNRSSGRAYENPFYFCLSLREHKMFLRPGDPPHTKLEHYHALDGGRVMIAEPSIDLYYPKIPITLEDSRLVPEYQTCGGFHVWKTMEGAVWWARGNCLGKHGWIVRPVIVWGTAYETSYCTREGWAVEFLCSAEGPKADDEALKAPGGNNPCRSTR